MKSTLLLCIVLAGNAAAEVAMPSGAALEADIVGHYLQAVEHQQSAMRGVSMEVDIDASVPKLQKQGKLRALRNISKLGKITYHMLGFDGDNSVKKEVIARYLSAEIEAQSGPSISISPDNYRFKYKGSVDHDGHSHYVLAVAPRKKTVGLFKGEIWLDQSTYMPVREAGRFVKNPSVFLKKMQFVRIYEIQNGVSFPHRLESLVDTRLFGPVQLTIGFSNFSKDPESEVATVASITETQF